METIKSEPPNVETKLSNLNVLCTECTIAGQRPTNEDTVVVGQFSILERLLTMIVVADGMGGHCGGMVASALAVRIFTLSLLDMVITSLHVDDLLYMPDAILAAIRKANDTVIKVAASNAICEGMGTTFTVAVILDTTLYWASVGDSRCYLYRNGELRQLTHDDSVVQDLIDQGYLTPEEAVHHPRANEITRCLGTPEAIDGFTVSFLALEPGDILLGCSDGVWKCEGTDFLNACSLLSFSAFTTAKLKEVARLLVDKALLSGADDNLSVAMLWVSDTFVPASPDPLNTNLNDPVEE